MIWFLCSIIWLDLYTCPILSHHSTLGSRFRKFLQESRQKSGKSISFLFDSLLLSFVDRITFTSLFSLVHPFVGLGQLFLFDGTSQAKYKNGIFGMSWALFVSSFIQGFHRISEQTGLLNSFNTMINK